MVSIPQQTQAGIICPECFKPLPYPIVMPPFAAEGQTFRLYQGYCFDCRRGFIAVQFAGLGGKWILHKYQIYTLQNNIPFCNGQWQFVVDLPPVPQPAYPPPVVTGPGGDYYKGYTPDERMPKFLADLAGILGTLKEAVVDMAGLSKK